MSKLPWENGFQPLCREPQWLGWLVGSRRWSEAGQTAAGQCYWKLVPEL